jgi:hypothetical protein
MKRGLFGIVAMAAAVSASSIFFSAEASAAGIEVAQAQAASPSAEARGGGSGAALRTNFTEAAKSADARRRPTKPGLIEFDRGRPPELPSRPSSGKRKRASTSGFAPPQTLRIRLCDIAAIPCAFDGVAQSDCASCTNPPPDPNAAVGAGKIVEVVNDLI